MNILRVLVVPVGVATAMLAGCTTVAPDVPAVGLDDTGWILSAIHATPVSSAPRITMSFDGGRVHGSDGCNRYGGTYTVRGAHFKVGEHIAVTRMACPEPVMRRSEAFLAALRAANAYRTDGQQLTLLDAGGNALASFDAQSTSLAGTSWRVTAYNNAKQALVSVAAGSELTAEFSADGRLSGSAGCNRYAAEYTTSGKSIKISQAAATRRFCPQPQGVMEQEGLFLKALADAATYRVEGDCLELRTVAGALAVTLTAAGKL